MASFSIRNIKISPEEYVRNSLDQQLNTDEYIDQNSRARAQLHSLGNDEDLQVDIYDTYHSYGVQCPFQRLMVLSKASPSYQFDLRSVGFVFKEKGKVLTSSKDVESRVLSLRAYCDKKLTHTISVLPRGICHRFISDALPLTIMSIPVIALETLNVFDGLSFFNAKVLDENQLYERVGQIKLLYQNEISKAYASTQNDEEPNETLRATIERWSYLFRAFNETLNSIEKITRKRKWDDDTFTHCMDLIRSLQKIVREEIVFALVIATITKAGVDPEFFRQVVNWEEERLVTYIKYGKIREKAIGWYLKHFHKEQEESLKKRGKLSAKDSSTNKGIKKMLEKSMSKNKTQNVSMRRPTAPPNTPASNPCNTMSGTPDSNERAAVFMHRFTNAEMQHQRQVLKETFDAMSKTALDALAVVTQNVTLNETSVARRAPEQSLIDFDHECEISNTEQNTSNAEREQENENDEHDDNDSDTDSDKFETAVDDDSSEVEDEFFTVQSTFGDSSANKSKSREVLLPSSTEWESPLEHFYKTHINDETIEERRHEVREKPRSIFVDERPSRAASTPKKTNKKEVTFNEEVEEISIISESPSEKLSSFKERAEQSNIYSNQSRKPVLSKVVNDIDKDKSRKKLSKTLTNLKLDDDSFKISDMDYIKSITNRGSISTDSGISSKEDLEALAIPIRNKREFLRERQRAMKFNKIADVKLTKPFKGDKICSELDTFIEQGRKPNTQLQKLLKPKYTTIGAHRQTDIDDFIEDSDDDYDDVESTPKSYMSQIVPNSTSVQLNTVQIQSPNKLKITEQQLKDLMDIYQQEKKVEKQLQKNIDDTSKEISKLMGMERTNENIRLLTEFVTFLKCHKDAFDKNQSNLESIKKSLISCKKALRDYTPDPAVQGSMFSDDASVQKFGEILASSIKTCLNPPIQLQPKKFSGFSYDFDHFWSIFKLAVHDNEAYRDKPANKLIALQKCVSHLPQCRRIMLMRPSAENYNTAIELLNNWYNHSLDKYNFALHRLQFVIKILPPRIHEDDYVTFENICNEIDRFYKVLLTIREDKYSQLADMIHEIAKKLPGKLIDTWCKVKDTIIYKYNHGESIETLRNGEKVTLLVTAKVRDQEFVRKFLSLLEQRIDHIERLARARGQNIRSPGYKPHMTKSQINFMNKPFIFDFNDCIPKLDHMSESDFKNPEATIAANFATKAATSGTAVQVNATGKVFRRQKNRSRKNATRRSVTARNKDYDYRGKLEAQSFSANTMLKSGQTAAVNVSSTTPQRTRSKRRNTYTPTADRFKELKKVNKPKARNANAPRCGGTRRNNNKRPKDKYTLHGAPSGKCEYTVQKPLKISHENADYLPHMQKNQNFYAGSKPQSRNNRNVQNKPRSTPRSRLNNNNNRNRNVFPKGTKICLFCNSKNDHITAYCKATDKTPEQRKAIAMKHGLCINCLFHNHNAADCKKGNCRVVGCNRKHHDLLHVYGRPAASNQSLMKIKNNSLPSVKNFSTQKSQQVRPKLQKPRSVHFEGPQ